jgi:hypothetical protein
MKPGWKKYVLYGSAIIGGGILLSILVETIKAKNTGFETKTLWDWMELLIIPLVLAIGAFFLQRSERAVEREAADIRARREQEEENRRARLEHELATDRQQEGALQAYLDRMAELLLKEKLLEGKDEKVLNVARVRTLTVMRGLNCTRNAIVLRFLLDIGLAGNMESNLFVNANLEGVDLERVNLSLTNLENAKLKSANLKGANLKDADLHGADLTDASLREANLTGANVSSEQLKTVYTIKGATMPDGTKHD